MKDMAAYSQIETAIGSRKLEDALVLESQPGGKVCVARSSHLQVMVNDVNSEHAGSGKEFSQARGSFASAASGVEYVRLSWDCIAANQRDLLRPNGARLRIQAAHHRLVGHLLRLGVQIGHC